MNYEELLHHSRQLSTDTTGTVIDFKTTEPIDHAVVATLVEALRSRIPGLSIALRAYGRSQ